VHAPEYAGHSSSQSSPNLHYTHSNPHLQEAIDYGICDRIITKKEGGLDLRDDMSSLSRGIG
jgi:hypothetical protein